MKERILRQIERGTLEREEIRFLLETHNKDIQEALRKKAWDLCQENYGDSIFIRGLVEFSNYCKQTCYYCGINGKNSEIQRFRLPVEEVLSACEYGYNKGFRTFVLQGGEDPSLEDDYFVSIIKSIKKSFPDTRITLSLGVRSYESLKKLKEAGADRYLLRHEAANEELFEKLHPKNQSFEERRKTLYHLKDLGFVVGSGFMIGAPFQTIENILEDFDFLQELQPQMIGVGPFIHHKDTIFHGEGNGDLELSLKVVSILRILFPQALIPSTTALNSIHPQGRILGMLHGANVVMPNLSPEKAKQNYSLYDNKAIQNLEAAAYIHELDEEFMKIGKKIKIDVGDPIDGKRG